MNLNLQTVPPELAGLLGHPIGCRPAPGAPCLKRPQPPPQQLSFGAFCATVRADTDGVGEKRSKWPK
eukprot:6676367-Alexandrium_andersonii.AAC.1